MTLSAQEANPARGEKLTAEQQDLLARVGECWGPELIRRLFWLRLGGKPYSQWARERGYSLSLVKAVIAQKRADLNTAPKARAVRADLARDLGLPEEVLFGGSPLHDPNIAHSDGKDHANPATGVAQE